MSMKKKWIITGVLCALAVLTVVVVTADGCFDFKAAGSVQSNDSAAVESASPDSETTTTQTDTTHTVHVTAGNGGTTDPNGSVTVSDWGSITINITANEGYEIHSVMVDGEDKGTVESYTVSNVTEDHSIVATFSKKAAESSSETDD